MPVLLLAYGDPEAKAMLRSAIEARYGSRPPVLDSLKVDFDGRARVKVGPVHTWVPIDATAYFRFPDAMRLDFTVRPMKLPIQAGMEAFDGETCRSVRGGKPPVVLTDPEHVSSMRRRLWAVAGILLTPLGDQTVKLTEIGPRVFEALNTKLDDSVKITLHDDNSMESVHVNCLNPATDQNQNYILRPSAQMKVFGDLLIPEKISVSWDDMPSFELQPTSAEGNPTISDEIFRLEEQTATP